MIKYLHTGAGLCSADLWAGKLRAVRAYSPPVKTKRRPEKEFGGSQSELITVLHGEKEQTRREMIFNIGNSSWRRRFFAARFRG